MISNSVADIQANACNEPHNGECSFCYANYIS